MHDLYDKGGRSADFAVFIGQIRGTYRRRSSLMRELDAKGL